MINNSPTSQPTLACFVRDRKLRGIRLFSNSILIVFQYACRTVRPDFRKLPIGIYIDKRVYSAIIVVVF